MKRLSIVTLIMVFALAACSTTGDPRTGGLFGWSRGKADQRIDEKQTTLTDTNTQINEKKLTQDQLKASKEERARELDRQKKRIALLEADISDLEGFIRNKQTTTQAGAKQKQRLEKELAQIKNEIGRVKQDNQASIQQKEAELADLNKQIDDLFKLAGGLQ